MRGYKVLDIDHQSFGEAMNMVSIAGGISGNRRVKYPFYPEPCWVKPNKGCGPLAVFKNFDCAKAFASQYGGKFIYEIKYRTYWGFRRYLWDSDGLTTQFSSLPEGSRLARKVKLVKEVWPNED